MTSRPTLDRPWAAMDDDQRAAATQWVVDTCLAFGTTIGTAHRVAGVFADGLDYQLGGSQP